MSKIRKAIVYTDISSDNSSIFSQNFRYIHICMVSIPSSRIRDERKLESIKIIDDRECKYYHKHPSSSMFFDGTKRKFLEECF